ncbi:kinase-like domain-containing protein, partial [Pavlovales sp. CCMP2436]
MPQGDYERLECVGKGNQGSVYRARHFVTGQIFVLKRAELDAEDDTLRQAALKEAELLGSLVHACVVRYHESFAELDGERTYICIVMEFCAGGDLHKRVEHASAVATKGLGPLPTGAPAGFFPESQVLLWFVQISLALHHVH